MARIRTLKPEYFRSRSLARCSVWARVTFQGLWVEADDYGRGIADARILKGSVWPLDDDVTAEHVENHLTALEDTGHIELYQVGGERYYQVLSWNKHVAAAYRRGAPIHPAPPGMQESADECEEVLLHRTGNIEQGTGNEEGDAEFAGFWSIYPRQVAKADARKSFAKARRGATLDAILAGLEPWLAYWQAKGEPDFIPHPTTWLNQCRWKDEPPKLNGSRAGPQALRSVVPSAALSRSLT